MSQQHQAPTKKFRVLLTQWETYAATLEASSAEEAEIAARQAWLLERSEAEAFTFFDWSIERVDVREIVDRPPVKDRSPLRLACDRSRVSGEGDKQ
jgi:hypothetical protein